MTIKTCPKCNIKKVMEDDYYKNKRTKSGYASYCKDCAKLSARTYNDTPAGRRKLYDIQAKRYQTKKADGTIVKYYKPVPQGEKKKTGRKPISPPELERREKQKQYEKEIKQCNKLINKLDIMINDSNLIINELEAKVQHINSTLKCV
jgi:hypothetical protein